MKNKRSKEHDRIKNLTQIEFDVRQLGYTHIAGIDEAGRGPLAGPVVAAACVLPAGILIEGINDSKQLTAAERESLFHQIISLPGVDYGIGVTDVIVIDQINILRATFEAMKQAVTKLKKKADYLLVDGLHLPTHEIPGLPIVDGDCKSQSIAAASILAKVTRDQMMLEYHRIWPQYGFHNHKGYATAEHLNALQKYGHCPIHRMSFEPLKSMKMPQQMELFQ